jgi:gluconolactonase
VAGSARGATAAPEFQGAMHYPDPAVEVLDPLFEKYRLTLSAVERVATGFRWAEGPVWFGEFGMLIFSDVSNNRMIKWDEDTGEVGIFRKPSNYSNGNTCDRQGRLVTCEGLTARVTRTGHWQVNGLRNALGRLVGCRDYPAHEGTHVVCRQTRNASARARR